MKISVIVVIKGAEFLTIAAQYVCLQSRQKSATLQVKLSRRKAYLNPLGLELLSSLVKSLKLAILIVDEMLGTLINSWKIGGLATGFP